MRSLMTTTSFLRKLCEMQHSFHGAVKGSAFLFLLSLCALQPVSLRGQQISGFSKAHAVTQRQIESGLMQSIQPSLMEELNREMSKEPHVAGSEAQGRVRDFILGYFQEWGLESRVDSYEIYMPWPTEVSLNLLTPEGSSGRWTEKAFRLREDVVPGDPTTAMEQYPWVNGYSGAGAVEADYWAVFLVIAYVR